MTDESTDLSGEPADEEMSGFNIRQTGKNIYRIDREDRESFDEEYMIARQRNAHRIQNIYILKRYMVNVYEYNRGRFKRNFRHMVPHVDLQSIITVLHYPPGTPVKFSKEEMGTTGSAVVPIVGSKTPAHLVSLPADQQLPTVHQTLRTHGFNTLHVFN